MPEVEDEGVLAQQCVTYLRQMPDLSKTNRRRVVYTTAYADADCLLAFTRCTDRHGTASEVLLLPDDSSRIGEVVIR